MKDNDYIQGLVNQDEKVLRAIYQNFSGRISNYIVKKGGSLEDAKDVFQDALMIILEKVQSPDFELSSGFYTYLYGVNKLVWYNKSRKLHRKSVTIPDDNTLKDQQSIEQELLNREMDNIYRENFAKLGLLCRQLLQLFFAKRDMTEIAETLELKNEHTARTRKYRCRGQLKKLMETDNRYQELVDNSL
ncbi:MAG: RNA polymerase sigma factor [Saprospiraceae bacterium]